MTCGECTLEKRGKQKTKSFVEEKGLFACQFQNRHHAQQGLFAWQIQNSFCTQHGLSFSPCGHSGYFCPSTHYATSACPF